MNSEKVPAKNALQLFEDFNESGVRYCHWKSNEHIKPGLMGNTDLDILIDPSDTKVAQQLMLKNNYKRVISHKWKLYSSVEDWIGLDEEQMLQTHLHVHYRLLTGLKNVKDQYLYYNELIFANTVMHEEYAIKICNPNIEILILIMRAALKSPDFILKSSVVYKKDVQRELQYLKQKIDESKLREYAYLMFSDSVANQILELLNGGEEKRLFISFRRALLKELRFLQRNSRSMAQIICYWRDIFYKVCKIIRRPVKLKKRSSTGGKLISFIGVDGAGKTTLAMFYAQWLAWKIDCQYVYLGTGDGKSSLLNRIKKIIVRGKRKKRIQSQQYHVADSCNNVNESEQDEVLTLKQTLRRTLSNVVCLSNDKYKLKTIKRIYKMVLNGRIVITDRYPQMDYFGIYDGMTVRTVPGKGLLAWVNRNFALREKQIYQEMCRFNPDIIVKLVVPMEVSVSRKPCSGKELETIKRKIEITDILHYPGSKEYIIDSSGRLEHTKHEVVSLLWRHI